jgi:hypothetical protein
VLTRQGLGYGGVYMSREKEDIGEVEVHPRAHFVFNTSLALNFSFVLRVLWVLDLDYM